MVVLVVTCVGTWGYSLWQLGSYVLYGLDEDSRLQRAVSTFTNYTALRDYFSPAPLSITATEVLPGGVNKYDLAAEVENSNNRFLVQFDYYFIVGETKTNVRHTFLLPGEKRPVVEFGKDFDINPGGAALVIENLNWTRLSSHAVVNTQAWTQEHLDFTTSDFVFTHADDFGGSSSHSIQFKVTNQSAYGYADAQFYVALFLQQSLVGIIPLQEKNFQSQETRLVTLHSFVPNLQVTDVKLFPVINIYDQGVYMGSR
jgi:hypothetical protein